MDTPDRSRPAEADTVSGADRVFPTLTEKQVARIAAHGRRRSTTRGEVLVEARCQGGARSSSSSAGEVEAVRPGDGATR